MAMTLLERTALALQVLRNMLNKEGLTQGRDIADDLLADIRAHLTQPAQAVDVVALAGREVSIDVSTCCCGNAMTLGVVHRTDGPCFHYVEPTSESVEHGDETHAFKNFHRAICERFGYTHDEKDWRRDQVSLIEFIAAQHRCVPDGFVMVPREPTDVMRAAFCADSESRIYFIHTPLQCDDFDSRYCAMLVAATSAS